MPSSPADRSLGTPLCGLASDRGRIRAFHRPGQSDQRRGFRADARRYCSPSCWRRLGPGGATDTGLPGPPVQRPGPQLRDRRGLLAAGNMPADLLRGTAELLQAPGISLGLIRRRTTTCCMRILPYAVGAPLLRFVERSQPQGSPLVRYRAVLSTPPSPNRNFASGSLLRLLCGYEFARLCADRRSGRIMGLTCVQAAEGL